MTLQIDTVIGNKEPSPKLKRMLLDFRSNTAAWLDGIEEIREQAQKEGFTEDQTKLLLRQYLRGFLKKRQVEWILTDKPRIERQKKLIEKHRVTATDANVPINEPETVSFPTDYNIVVPEQVLEEETKRLQQEQQQEGSEPVSEVLEKLKANQEIQNLKMEAR